MSQSESGVVGKVCPYCQATIGAASPSVVCSQCGTAHHSECWRRGGRCSTPGCEGTPISTRTGTAVPMGAPYTPPAQPVAPPPAPAAAAPPGLSAPGSPMAPAPSPAISAAPVMGTQAALRLRPMGLLEIVDQTFRLYRANFGLFFTIMAAVYIPVGLLSVIPDLRYIMVALALPISLFANGALTKAVSDRYLGRQSSVGESYSYLFARLIPFIGTIIVAYLLVGVGLVLLAIPGIVFMFWVTFLTPTFVIEDKRYFDAIWRGRFLVGQGVWAEALVVGLVVGVLSFLIKMLVQIPAEVIVGVSSGAFSGNPAAALSFSPIHLIAGLLVGAGQALVAPLLLVSLILLYYDSRIRKEGFDLQMLAREMGQAAPASVAAPPPPPLYPPAPPSGGAV